MAETELEKRKRCPKCKQLGRDNGTLPSTDPTKKVLTMICENKRCEWDQTGWAITLRLDGSLPSDDVNPLLKPKGFPVLERGVSGDDREAQIKAFYEQYNQ